MTQPKRPGSSAARQPLASTSLNAVPSISPSPGGEGSGGGGSGGGGGGGGGGAGGGAGGGGGGRGSPPPPPSSPFPPRPCARSLACRRRLPALKNRARTTP